MKQLFKQLLKTAGLYDMAQRYNHMRIHYSHERLRLQFAYRFKGAPDGYPVPPPRLVHKIIARGWAEQYWSMGKDEAGAIIHLLRRNDIDPADFNDILDFGCGCGRLIRHFRSVTDARLHGSDYNPKLVGWCQRNLGFGSFAVNQLDPPLPYEDDRFDFIYLISVFTHLSAALQQRWMAELRRILRPGGYILFTTHGDRFLSFFDADQRRRFEADEVVVIDRDAEGTNHYGSFQTRANVETTLLEGFELTAFERGAAELAQDKYLVWLTAKGS